MKSSVQLAVGATAAVLLVVGLIFGLRPISAEVTLVSPEIFTANVQCGIGYLPGVPGNADLVPLKSDPGVVLPRKAYAEHCSLATSWQPFVAWGLTALGALGLALTFVTRRNRVEV